MPSFGSDRVEVEVLLQNYYDVGDILAFDKYAIIYKAVRKEDGKELACMELKNISMACEAAAIDDFPTLQNISHRNIVSHVQWISDNAFTYIIMEPMPGAVLLEQMGDHGPVSETRAVKIIKQVLNASDYLHSHGIVHRDLYPEHLFFKDVSNCSPIMLCGFGMAAVCHNAYNSESLKGRCGRLGFISPERTLEKSYNAKVDIWSIGIITYILLSGDLPFASNEPEKYLDEIQNSSPSLFNSTIWNKISQNAKDFINCLLSTDFSQRPTAVEAMAHKWIVDDALNVPLLDKEQLSRSRNDVKKRLLLTEADWQRIINLIY